MFKEAFRSSYVQRTNTYMSSSAASMRMRGSVQLVRRWSKVPATCQRTCKRLTQLAPPSCALQPAILLADCSASAVERPALED